VSAGAQVAEGLGDLHGAVDAFRNAAQNWHALGVVTEEAFALLGQGRCLVRLDEGAEAWGALERAFEIFTNLGAVPSLAETSALLKQLPSA
jgi:hypothetical protein